MPRNLALLTVPIVCGLLNAIAAAADGALIPLAEHPRPDFERADWVNLNGAWAFRFDPKDEGEQGGWSSAELQSFPLRITVPFAWGSALSGVADEADIGWYARALRVPAAWKGKRVFLVIGAADWHTTGWLDGRRLGTEQGGYLPFEFELTPHLSFDREQLLVLRIDDARRPFKLEGKQGYGQARGIWQTAYLEARAPVHLTSVRFVPDLAGAKVTASVRLKEKAPRELPVKIRFPGGEAPDAEGTVPAGSDEAALAVAIPRPRPWSPRDPFLYQAEVIVDPSGPVPDTVRSYFGLRSIGTGKLPGTDYVYVTLNGEPFYLQLALDQAYHAEGFYTFPSDEFLREEILRSLRIGLNAIRIHVKIDMPRKLYWADRLGLLVMADVPNSWGEPDARMRAETESALRGMIARDFNHPSIFSWVVFNETWGLTNEHPPATAKPSDMRIGNKKHYAADTQEWVRSMFRLAKSLDPTRPVEDNSPCNYDHVETDLNTWHSYLPGYAWRETLDRIVRDTYPGSGWNFAPGCSQGGQPLLNSECGNVWGYEGSTGDVDWSWDYHLMINEFRRHPKVCGWLYTEHHDVINEWNGYYRFDRSEKITGLSALVPGMTLRDLHGPFYIAPGLDLCVEAKPGEKVKVPLWASFLSGSSPSPRLILRSTLRLWDRLGREETLPGPTREIGFVPWMSREIDPLEVAMPDRSGLALLALSLEDPAGTVLQKNFTTFLVSAGPAPRDEEVALEGGKARVLRFAPASFAKADWSLGQWNILDGLKVNGAGAGYFEYRLPWPEGLDPDRISAAGFRAELSAKRLNSKDRKASGKQEGDFMRGKGTHDPGLNPNSYPMTDTRRFRSAVRVRVAGEALGTFGLENDPADHRGILSWHSQRRDKKLREAGSYGYLIQAAISPETLRAAARAKEIVLRLEVDPALPGGLAIYGERFGRCPLDPTLVFFLK